MKTFFILSFLAFCSWACFAEVDKTPEKSPLQLKLRAQNMILEGEGQRNISSFDEKSSTLKIPCTVCSNVFLAVNTNLHPADRGMDRDFCCHSKSKSSYDFNIWTCTKCGYSNHKSFFSFGTKAAMTETELASIKDMWVALFLETLGVNLLQYGAPVDQEDIPSFLKYQMMFKILPKLDLTWKVRADFFLNFAWIERMRLCAPIMSPTLSTTISSINDALKDYEKANKIDLVVSKPKECLVFLDTLEDRAKNDISYRFLIKLYQASQMNRLGLTGRAHELLKEAVLLDIDASWRNIANFKIKVLLHEIALLKEAVIAMKEAIKAGEYQGEECASVIYLCGELQRRIGLFAEADAWFVAAQDISSPLLKEWAKEQRQSYPKSLVHPVSDGENILIHKAMQLAREADLAPTFTPQSLSHERAKKWLEALDMASINYFRRYGIDPDSLEELFDLDLLKIQPDLPKDALRFFNMRADKKSIDPSIRYSFDCLIPFSDGSQFFLLSSNKGVISKKESKP